MIGDIETRPAKQLQAALQYAARGWPVFPCSANDKRPLVGASKPGAEDAGLYRATCDEAEIRGWWARWPDALIGVPTGQRIGAFVVDLDPTQDTTAYQLLETLRSKIGGKLPPCPLVSTPRKGMHLWFKMPAGVKIGNRANLLKAAKTDAKIDVRGTGGYVILPPSERRGPKAIKDGCDRIRYSWELDAGLDDLGLPEPPAALVLMIASPDRNEEPKDRDRPVDQATRVPRVEQVSARERQYALSAFDAEIRAVQNAGKGQRNTVLNNAALKLASLVATGVLSESMVKGALEDAASVCGLVKDDGWKSVRATIGSGFKAGLARPRDLSEAAIGPAFPQRNQPEPPPGAYDDPSDSAGDGGGEDVPPDGTDDAGGDKRKVVRLRAGRLPEALRDIEAAMLDLGPGPIYQRSGELVHIANRPVRRSDGAEEKQEVVANVEPAALLCEWSRKIRFERYDRRGKDWLPIDPPPKLADSYFGEKSWKLSNLHHLIATPTLRPDGSLLHERGYDQATGLFLTSELRGLNVPDNPTSDQADEALSVLTDLFNGFPYADREDEYKAGLGLSIALAGVIGAVLRPTLPAAPLIGVTAPKAGTGKSYLVDLIATIAIGQRATCMVSGVTAEEFQKSLGAALLAGLPLLSLDNMVQPVGGQLICMALTQERVDMRVLGLSKMANLPTANAMFATGNNLKLQGDLTRRALLCRLDARIERPEERSFDSDLLREARQRRAELVSAVLTIARWGFVRRQSPGNWSLDDPGSGKAFAGFETWCRRVRDPLVALGCPDPVAALDEVRAADPLGERLRILLNAWNAELGDGSKTCKEIVYAAQGGRGEMMDALTAVAGDGRGEINTRRLGNYLASNEGAIVDGMAFHRDGTSKNAVRWQLKLLSAES